VDKKYHLGAQFLNNFLLLAQDMAMRVVFTDSIVEQEKKIVYEEVHAFANMFNFWTL
jgi:hypothetical protein